MQLTSFAVAVHARSSPVVLMNCVLSRSTASTAPDCCAGQTNAQVIFRFRLIRDATGSRLVKALHF